MKIRASRKGNRIALASMTVAAVGLSALGASSTTLAQEAAAADQGASAGGLEEVTVTARRTEENLQDIPVSVQAISGQKMQNLLMTRPTDLSSIAAGLDIGLAAPNDPAITLRGVRWTPGSGTPATPIYLNEISFDPSGVLQTMYDLSQVEVLRGPQGTTRGAPSISGAVTMTTRKPDLQEMGGYVSGIVGEHDRRNGQGAISLPVIEDQLGVRLAGFYDYSSANRIDSLNNPDSPYLENKSARMSVRYTPTETILIDAMYQRLEQSGKFYTGVAGTGSPGKVAPPNVPANFNGPFLQSGQYKSVESGYSEADDTIEFYTINANWDVTEDYRLNYNFGDQHTQGHTATNRDPANILTGYDGVRPQQGVKGPTYYVHEARFSSIRDGDSFYDFDLGYYYQKFNGDSVFSIPTYLGGAFGSPLDTTPGQVTSPNLSYVLNANGVYPVERNLESFYASVELHLTDETEFTAGARTISDKSYAAGHLDIVPANGVAAYQAFVNPIAGFTCDQLAALSPGRGIQDSTTYGAPVCQANAVAPAVPDEGGPDEHDKTIYNVSLSHRFTDDVLGYATTGTSYRSGIPSLNNPGLPTEYFLPEPETATSYELGVKTNWSDWLVVNASVFYIEYKDQLTQFKSIPYWNASTGREGLTSVAFFQNTDANVTGGELEISAAPIENLTLTTYLSYSSIESEGGDLPCIDPSRPITANNIINTCPLEDGENINATPKFQASFTSNYILPLGPFDGYLRSLISYQDENPNFGASLEDADAYATVDLFAGITGDDGGWDVGLYTKNLFNTRNQLSIQSAQTNSVYPDFGPITGYDTVVMNMPREIGMSFQYAFGSR